jgi:hypothetical protein
MDGQGSRIGRASRGRVARRDPVPRLERVGRVRVHTVATLELIDPVSLFYALAITAGAVAGMVVATMRLP